MYVAVTDRTECLFYVAIPLDSRHITVANTRIYNGCTRSGPATLAEAAAFEIVKE